MDGMFVLSKSVDLSVLREGFSIPAYMHQTIYEKMGIVLNHGQKQPIKLLLNGKMYDASLINQGFSKQKILIMLMCFKSAIGQMANCHLLYVLYFLQLLKK